MKVAIPLAEGKLSPHFGHCEKFTVFNLDVEKKEIKKREDLVAPPHEPGLLPKWLAEKNVNMIIAGGMGQRAQALFKAKNIEVVIGANALTPEKLIESFISGELKSGENFCNH
ncbi:MAG: NifB/NifX family molybdenum-iron cluster-binding protein [bacterium]